MKRYEVVVFDTFDTSGNIIFRGGRFWLCSNAFIVKFVLTYRFYKSKQPEFRVEIWDRWRRRWREE